jgi:magnesium-transporting ATPase (P-type)
LNRIFSQSETESNFLEKEQGDHTIPGWVEPLVIFSILVLNAVVSIYQDYDAEKAVDALKDLQSLEALVLRDSNWTHIPSKDLVPGDIVEVLQLNLNNSIRSIKVTRSPLTSD